MRLLQVCNVGRIIGGTAACAWSVAAALPEHRHAVAVLGPIDPAMRDAFGPIPLRSIGRVTPAVVAGFDAVILHNTAAARCERLPIPSLLYRHSPGGTAAATRSVCCSRWLGGRLGIADEVLHQGVPRTRPQPRGLGDRLVVGRICTPTPRKWPPDLPAFSRRLATRHPQVRWEFVGCPEAMQPALRDACGEQVRFHAAGWAARRHLGRWDALLYSNPALPETFGRTVAEAMLAGCVPIVDDAGGFREQVDPDRSGFLCRDVDDFDAALTTLRDPIRRRRLSHAAMQCGEAFTHAAFGRRLRPLLGSLIGQATPDGVPRTKPASCHI